MRLVLTILFFLLTGMGATAAELTDAKTRCAIALEGLGYTLDRYSREEAGWIAREKHIFNEVLICQVNKNKEVHSISDDGVTIAEDGFYGKDALAKRDALNSERENALEDAKNRINKDFDRRLQKVRDDSEPAASAAERKERAAALAKARKAEEERVAKEKAEAKEAKRKAEKLALEKRKSEIAKVKARTGSTVSIDISDPAQRACADLLAGHLNNVDVHQVKSESFWGGKYTVWYRDRVTSYAEGQYHTRKCQIKDGSVRILSVFQSWD